MEAQVSEHAVERYIERVKSWLTLEEAREELERLVAMCDGPSEPPEHLRKGVEEESHTFAEVAPGIWLVIADGKWAVTCITNGCLSEETRAERNRRKALRRRAKRHKQRGGRPAQPAPEASW